VASASSRGPAGRPGRGSGPTMAGEEPVRDRMVEVRLLHTATPSTPAELARADGSARPAAPPAPAELAHAAGSARTAALPASRLSSPARPTEVARALQLGAAGALHVRPPASCAAPIC
jgi:hypothetical protein